MGRANSLQRAKRAGRQRAGRPRGAMTDNRVDIRDRVARHDLRYDAVPCTYFEGFILGNGDLGAVLWFEEDRMVLSLGQGRCLGAARRPESGAGHGLPHRPAASPYQQLRS